VGGGSAVVVSTPLSFCGAEAAGIGCRVYELAILVLLRPSFFSKMRVTNVLGKVWSRRLAGFTGDV
jgi:hypothetical protein